MNAAISKKWQSCAREQIKYWIDFNNLASQIQELQLEHEVYTAREVDNGKRIPRRSIPLSSTKESLLRILQKRGREKPQQTERENLELKFEKERQYQQEMHEKQRQMWEEKRDAEFEPTQKKLEMENSARATTAKLPKQRIAHFKGTLTDWVRFDCASNAEGRGTLVIIAEAVFSVQREASHELEHL